MSIPPRLFFLAPALAACVQAQASRPAHTTAIPMTDSHAASTPASSPASRPANRLVKEKSPYLLQHAHNPVDWYPWGEEAFAKAKSENKPIFLSIGYSTCHWCHVMERESFENETIAKFLNENFVNIKIDREERPDIDRVYMAYVQQVTGGGGWPMSVWLTPDLKPFYGGTYFAPYNKYGRPGFLELLNGIAGAWKEKNADIQNAAQRAAEMLKEQAKMDAAGSGEVGADASQAGYLWFSRNYDEKLGGFGGAPKFPRPSCLLFLMRYYKRTNDARALEIATSTLRAMSRGGMHDPLGGGFHRYSVDARWHVPHFEKMLYDQGQLAIAYAEAFQITKDPEFAATLRDICDYVLRDMTAPGGAFFSAEDADSIVPGQKININDPAAHPEKREGAFYVFTNDEINKLLGAAAPAFSLRFGVEESGNADDPHGELTGQNVLFLAREIGEISRRLGLSTPEVESYIHKGKEILLKERNTRPRPHLDDKILTSWNGLMISGLAMAATALDEPRYAAAAARAIEFIKNNLYNNKTGELLRRHRDGESALRGQCDDYAFLIQGLLDLYHFSFDTNLADFATKLAATQDRLFYDSASGAWWSSPEGDASVLVRMIEDYDGAEPAPSSVAARNAFRLSEINGEANLKKTAARALRAFAPRLVQFPAAVPQMLAALEWQLAPSQHVVVVGDAAAEDTKTLLRALRNCYIPNATILQIGSDAARDWFAARLPFTAGMKSANSKAAAFVCIDRACRLPVTSADELARSLR